MKITVCNLLNGTEGWMSMNDSGYQVYKGESSELMAEEKPVKGEDPTRLHMENFLSAVRSRNYSELHDGINNAHLSAGLCHLANISYRTGHKLTLEAGPKFTGDAAANRLMTRDAYRKGVRSLGIRSLRLRVVSLRDRISRFRTLSWAPMLTLLTG